MYMYPKSKRAEMERNALLLYPYISDKTISHGKAAEILGISKFELIELYNDIGLPYLSMDISEIEDGQEALICAYPVEVSNWERLKGYERCKGSRM